MTSNRPVHNVAAAAAPWFALPGTTGHPEGPSAAESEFSARLVDSFAATLAQEVLLVSQAEPAELPPHHRCAALLRPGCAVEPPPSALREATAGALRLEEMRPEDVQDAAARGVPVLLPVAGIDMFSAPRAGGGGSGGSVRAGERACGADLLAVRAQCERAAEQRRMVFAPPLSCEFCPDSATVQRPAPPQPGRSCAWARLTLRLGLFPCSAPLKTALRRRRRRQPGATGCFCRWSGR